MAALFEAYITNLGKYNEGELVGETLKFPTSPQAVEALLKNIGVDGIRYEEFFITSFDGDVLGLYDYLGEYENLDELNHLACLLSELDKEELAVFEAVMDSGEYTGSVKDLINLSGTEFLTTNTRPKKGDGGVPIKKQPLAGAGVGDVGELVGADPQVACQHLLIPSRLGQHIEKIAVAENGLNFAALQQAFHILGDPAGDGPPFAETPENLHTVRRRLGLRQQNVKLVLIYPGRPPPVPVLRHPAPDLVREDQQPDLFEHLPQGLDVEAQEAGIDLDVGSVVKEVEGPSAV